MSTPILDRLKSALDAEARRMTNEWFFKWHSIGNDAPVEIDSFDGRTMRFCRVEFWGTPERLYWTAISLYLNQKLIDIFQKLEEDLAKYPIAIRRNTLTGAEGLIKDFVNKIRKQAKQKDRILRGNGMEFPAERDLGDWKTCSPQIINNRLAVLASIYGIPSTLPNGGEIPMKELMTDLLTLVKKDGALVKEDIKGMVSSGKIITFDHSLPIEQEDHFIRKLPSGLAEDYVIDDPGYFAGIQGIDAHFQCRVRRAGTRPEAPTAIVNNIHAHFEGANSRLNVGSTDNSLNVVQELDVAKVESFLEQLESNCASLPLALQRSLAPLVQEVRGHLSVAEPNLSKIRVSLQSIKTICEGTVGNLLAAGIGIMLGNILG